MKVVTSCETESFLAVLPTDRKTQQLLSNQIFDLQNSLLFKVITITDLYTCESSNFVPLCFRMKQN